MRVLKIYYVPRLHCNQKANRTRIYMSNSSIVFSPSVIIQTHKFDASRCTQKNVFFCAFDLKMFVSFANRMRLNFLFQIKLHTYIYFFTLICIVLRKLSKVKLAYKYVLNITNNISRKHHFEIGDCLSNISSVNIFIAVNLVDSS